MNTEMKHRTQMSRSHLLSWALGTNQCPPFPTLHANNSGYRGNLPGMLTQLMTVSWQSNLLKRRECSEACPQFLGRQDLQNRRGLWESVGVVREGDSTIGSWPFRVEIFSILENKNKHRNWIRSGRISQCSHLFQLHPEPGLALLPSFPARIPAYPSKVCGRWGPQKHLEASTQTQL